MDNLKKMELLTDLFEMENGELTAETQLEELENWDSMMKLSLIVMIDDEFGKPLPGEQLKAFQTVQDILDFMDT